MLFVNDIVLFGKADRWEACKMKNILDCYYRLSGKAVNTSKSSMIFSANTPDNIKEDVLTSFGVPGETKMGNYLGVSIEWVEAFWFMLERLELRAHSWKNSLLSFARRETMINVVLQEITSYLFSYFKLPLTLLKNMNVVLVRFWLSGDTKKKDVHWIAMEKLFGLKTRGGMGFLNFEDLNLAFIAKLAWRIVTQPTPLWVKVLKAMGPNGLSVLANKSTGT
ncbi:Putative ribonuclease H protein At1g65750 [Linum perenne]